MKELEKNPIYLYTGQPCAIYDTEEPVFDIIEGCDFANDKIIAERVNWSPDIIKPILRNVSNITNEEALEVANLVWFALGNKKIDKVEVKATHLFGFVAIYFDWSQDKVLCDSAEDKQDYLDNCGEIKTDSFILSLDNAHHTIKLFRVDSENNDKLIPMQVYQSHKVTAYLIMKGFNLGILEEGTYILKD